MNQHQVVIWEEEVQEEEVQEEVIIHMEDEVDQGDVIIEQKIPNVFYLKP